MSWWSECDGRLSGDKQKVSVADEGVRPAGPLMQPFFKVPGESILFRTHTDTHMAGEDSMKERRQREAGKEKGVAETEHLNVLILISTFAAGKMFPSPPGHLLK